MKCSLAQDKKEERTSFNSSQCFLNPKIKSEVQIKRPEGYALPGFVALSVTAEAEGFLAKGYGEGPREIAREKAISEAFERLALFKFRSDNQSKETSSGWAAHRSADLAIQAAVFELIERDVALTVWENGGPFYLIPETLWPKNLVLWKESSRAGLEFYDLHVLLSANGNGSCVSVLLFNQNGNFVAGHASAFRLEDAILSAAKECFRAAHSAIQFAYFHDVKTLHSGQSGAVVAPGAHSLAYAYKEILPEIVRIERATADAVLSHWMRYQTKVNNFMRSDFNAQLFQVGDRIVARVKCPRYREIFWGRTSDWSKPNQHPHFVG